MTIEFEEMDFANRCRNGRTQVRHRIVIMTMITTSLV